MDKPSVTYVSLTNDASNMFADDFGHRFLVLQCYGQYRVIQANNGAGCGGLENCVRRSIVFHVLC